MLADQEARKLAATDFKNNQVVLAGAGTGKTSLLVERMLNACIGEDMSLRHVVAITFTEKAAAEMRDRIADALECFRSFSVQEKGEAERSLSYLREEKKLDDATIMLRAGRMFNELDDALITTIHGLCADLLRRYPIQAGVDPYFQVDEGLFALRLMNEVWEDWINKELQNDAGNKKVWTEILQIVDIQTIYDLARELVLLDFSMRTVGKGEALAERLLKDCCKDLANEIDGVLMKISGENPNMRAYLEIESRCLRGFVKEGVAALAQEIVYPVKNVPDVGKKLVGVDPHELKELAKKADQILKRLKEVDPETIKKLNRLLLSWTDAFWSQYKRGGYVSFQGLLQNARDLLLDNPVLRKREKKRIQCLLLDEFQDTSPLQYEIIFLLTENENKSGKDPFKTCFHPGKTFIVGDLKQSIYRFNGADIHVCELMSESLRKSGAKVLKLHVSFRSPGTILDPLNHLFSKSFERVNQVPYEAISAFNGTNHSPSAVQLWTIESEQENDKMRALRVLEAQGIADWIENKRENYHYKDIAVLFRSMSDVSIYLEAMRERGIPFVVEGGKTFTGKPEVREFLALLKAVSRPGDEVALLAVLRSPIGAVTDVELAHHAKGNGAWSIDTRVDEKMCPNIARAFEKLKGLVELCQTVRPETAIRIMMDEMQMNVLNALSYEGSQRVANLNKIADRAINITRSQYLSLAETLDILEEDFSHSLEGESPLADEKLDAVRVLTIHKAKGLEFPVVIIPDLIRETRGVQSAKTDADWKHLYKGQYGLSLRIRLRNKTLRSLANVYLDFKEKTEDENEQMRLFYVATTRAKQKLIMFVSPAKRSLWIDALAAWDYPSQENVLLGGAIENYRLIQKREMARVRSLGIDHAQLIKAVENFHSARNDVSALQGIQWLRSPSQVSDEERNDGKEPAFSGVQTRKKLFGVDLSHSSRLAGSAVHWLLRFWDLNDLAWFRSAVPCAVKKLCLHQTDGERQVYAAVEEIIDSFLESKIPMLMQQLDIVGREVPFQSSSDEFLMQGSIDLVYRSNGDYVIVDYKTDRVASGSERKTANQYKAQLEAYAQALKMSLSLKSLPKQEIWFLRMGKIVCM